MKQTALLFVVMMFLVTPLQGQVSVTDLSYFPLQVGNIWRYHVSWVSHPGVYDGYVTRKILKDTLLQDGRRYAVFSTDGHSHNTLFRVDSTTGIVYQYVGTPTPTSCPSLGDQEHLNLTVDSADAYGLCPNETFDVRRVRSSNGAQRVSQLYINRQQRTWVLPFFGWNRDYAEGIGLCYWTATDKQYELVYARIDGTSYFPVELRSFDAIVLPGNAVHLRWVTENEMQNRGFTVQRKSLCASAESWENITFVPSQVPEGQGAVYEFTDNTAAETYTGERLSYRLEQQDYDGTASYSPVTEVILSGGAPQPTRIHLYPNPSSSAIAIAFELQSGTTGQISITDILGREIRQYSNVSGNQTLQWDLTNTAGIRVVPGMYIISLISSNERVVRSVIVR